MMRRQRRELDDVEWMFFCTISFLAGVLLTLAFTTS